MKRLVPLFFFFCYFSSIAQENFITVWDMNNSGTAANEIMFTITTTPNTPVIYNWTADDGSSGNGIIPADITIATITGLPQGQIVTLSIEPDNIRTFMINNTPDRLRLTDILQWGSVSWLSMKDAFNGASNLNISATDLPDLSQATSTSAMFKGCMSLNGPANINDWNMSSVTDISSMFYGTTIFNRDIGNWNTTNVTDMNSLFSNAYQFNKNISNWDISQVTNMDNMFYAALSFNQDIGNWNTKNVTDMGYMFCYAQSFNQNITNWNTANVVDMSSMFYAAIYFNQNMSNWKLSPNVAMDNMFLLSGMDCIHYSVTLIGWAANPDTPNDRNLDSVNILYGTNAEAARSFLISTKGWTILDDMLGESNCGLPQTITAPDVVKTYGDEPFVLNATTTSGLHISYVSSDNDIAEVFQDSNDNNIWKLKIKKAGEVNIKVQQYGNDLYASASDVIFKLTVNKAPLSVLPNAQIKTYGTTDSDLTYNVNGLKNGDDSSIITGNLTRTAGENIGTYAIEQGSLATTANYDLTYTAADFNITKATLNIVAEAKTKVYGTTDPALTYTVTGLANGDDKSIITGALTRVVGENIGTYAIEKGTLATTVNYDLTYTSADFNITKATLNVVAEAKTKVYGTTDPALTYTVTGLANGDDESIITGNLTRIAGENIGTYSIEKGTLATTANYDLVYTAADFNISKATLNIVADAKTKQYGTADPALTYIVTGFTSNDNETVLNGSLQREAGENIGTYAIEIGTLNAMNYSISFTGADFIIVDALQVNSFTQSDITCNGANNGSATVVITGGTQPYTYAWTPIGGNNATANGLTVGTYTVTITDANGFVVTQEFTITEPPVVVAPTAEALQTFCASQNIPIGELQAQGSQIKWYATTDAATDLPADTILTDGTTYYASQTINGCESVERTAVTVKLNIIETPVVEPYTLCQSATVADLQIVTPTGVSYKWYTTETGGTGLTEDTVLVTGIYYVEKTEGVCVSQRTAVQVTILELPESPTGATTQSFTVNNIGEATIADLVMDQENVIWYISLEDAMTGNNPLTAEMPLQHGQTYYAVILSTNGCPSIPTAVIVDITLSTDEFDKSGLKYYPNPTSDILNISYKNSMDRVTVYNLLGQKVLTQEANGKEVQLNMSALANGNYMIEIRSKKQTQFVKVVKK